ncbi:MAG TPA: hypothetical protein VNY31_02735 [Solirubrobacteraceae bacterium]|nr:hypothetical protein [Solirubrobacteraceae bacterium]
MQGPIGCGKTSLLRYALDDPNGATAPIWASVAFDEDAVVLDVRGFAGHLIQSIVRETLSAGTLSSHEREAVLLVGKASSTLPDSACRIAALALGLLAVIDCLR